MLNKELDHLVMTLDRKEWREGMEGREGNKERGRGRETRRKGEGGKRRERERGREGEGGKAREKNHSQHSQIQSCSQALPPKEE